MDAIKKEQIVKALKRPVGSFVFDITCDNKIFDTNIEKLILMEITSGRIVTRLERDSKLNLSFIHASPGTGTRITTVNVESLNSSLKVRFFLMWSPNIIKLTVGEVGGVFLSSEGCKTADYQLIAGNDGSVSQVGSKGIEVYDIMFVQNGKAIAENSAIKTWEESLNAIKILQTGTSTQAYLYENLVSNQLISLLCSSFEIYCKKRFLELSSEGIEPNYSNLEQVFFSKAERDKGLLSDFVKDAQQKRHSIANEIVERRRIDFGNYQNCKDAYAKGYGLRFPEDLGVDAKTIQSIIEFIGYRHKIIHVSPFLHILNILDVPKKEPIFSNKALVDRGVRDFDDFVRGLHKATLKLVSE